ncbi:hypothetical protein ACJMK2_030780 [Sinanodonta woodiana]|uniref:Uncharacterized protein n=1 Tax=Sinanodonta woodiana TaxID=1069815 RepID=A0ABD3WY42_SINWO
MEAHDSTLETIGIQEPQLPPSQRASSTHTILNATPSGEKEAVAQLLEIIYHNYNCVMEEMVIQLFLRAHLMKQVDMLTSIDQQIPSNIQEAV